MNAVLVLITFFAVRLVIPFGVLLVLGTWLEHRQAHFS